MIYLAKQLLSWEASLNIILYIYTAVNEDARYGEVKLFQDMAIGM